MKPEHRAALEDYVSSHNGKPLDSKAMLKPNPMVDKVLTARILSMTPDQVDALRATITPESSEVLKILLPELHMLIDKGATNGAAG